MPINDRWWALSTGVIDFDQDQPGVYELGDSNDIVIYVGSADKLKTRLKEHVDDKENPCIKKSAVKYRLEYNPKNKARELQLYDEHVRLYGKPPSCNRVRPSGY